MSNLNLPDPERFIQGNGGENYNFSDGQEQQQGNQGQTAQQPQSVQQNNLPAPPAQVATPNAQQPAVVTQPQPQQPVVKVTKQQSNGNGQKKEYPPRVEFYTKSSALLISINRDTPSAVFMETAPSIGDKRYDWQNQKIFVKMEIPEVDQILDCLNAFKVGGPQAFTQYAQYLQPNNQGKLSFYHESQKATTIIELFIGQKSGLPTITFSRKDKQNPNDQRYVYFTILPAFLSTFIRTLDRFADVAIGFPRTR